MIILLNHYKKTKTSFYFNINYIFNQIILVIKPIFYIYLFNI